jgi:hypothetical protein
MIVFHHMTPIVNEMMLNADYCFYCDWNHFWIIIVSSSWRRNGAKYEHYLEGYSYLHNPFLVIDSIRMTKYNTTTTMILELLLQKNSWLFVFESTSCCLKEFMMRRGRSWIGLLRMLFLE